jgi:hypothetical protein
MRYGESIVTGRYFLREIFALRLVLDGFPHLRNTQAGNAVSSSSRFNRRFNGRLGVLVVPLRTAPPVPMLEVDWVSVFTPCAQLERALAFRQMDDVPLVFQAAFEGAIEVSNTVEPDAIELMFGIKFEKRFRNFTVIFMAAQSRSVRIARRMTVEPDEATRKMADGSKLVFNVGNGKLSFRVPKLKDVLTINSLNR